MIPIVSAFFVFVYSWIAYYLYQLYASGCKCALGWKHTFLSVYIGYIIMVYAVQVFMPIPQYMSAVWIMGLSLLSSLIYLLVAWSYVRELENNHMCGCSEHTARKTWKWLIILGAVALAVVILGLIFIGLVVVTSMSSANATPLSAKRVLKHKDDAI